MTLTVKSALIKDERGRIKFKKWSDEGREHYHVKLWIDGEEDELRDIREVEYVLHPSFRKNRRMSTDRSTNFSINIWTYGYFPIEVIVRNVEREMRMLKYSLVFELPYDDGTNYVQI